MEGEDQDTMNIMIMIMTKDHIEEIEILSIEGIMTMNVKDHTGIENPSMTDRGAEIESEMMKDRSKTEILKTGQAGSKKTKDLFELETKTGYLVVEIQKKMQKEDQAKIKVNHIGLKETPIEIEKITMMVDVTTTHSMRKAKRQKRKNHRNLQRVTEGFWF